MRASSGFRLTLVLSFLACLSVLPGTGAVRPTLAAMRNGSLRGKVTDKSGSALAEVEVILSELSRETRTGEDGAYALPDLAPGRYTLIVRRLGYAPITQDVSIGTEAVTLDIPLVATPFAFEPVGVTATRTPQPALDSPLPTAYLSGPGLARETSISISHAIEGLPGVRTVSTGGQIGKPMIRGLTGSRVLVLDGGHRLEDYSWSDEDGPSVDPATAERVEVIRGPASVLYGSDALGGVVNLIPPELPELEEGEGFTRVRTSAYFGSNSHEGGTAVAFEGTKHDLGWRISGAGRLAEALHTPDGELENTGFGAVTGDAALGLHGERGTATLRYVRYGGEFKLLEAGGPPPGVMEGEEGGPERKSADDRVQLDGTLAAGTCQLEAKAQFERHSLIEISDEALAEPAAPAGSDLRSSLAEKKKESEAFNLLLNTESLDLLLHHRLGSRVHGTLGVTGMHQMNDSKGPIPLVPDATVNSGAAFLFEEAQLGKVSFLAGARGDKRKLSADANEELALEDDDRDYKVFSGDAGIVLRPTGWLAVSANVGRAWRAPTLFDLYANGPQIAEERFLIGRADLDQEESLNLDGGVRWQNARNRGEISAYRNKIDNYIYTQPTAEMIGDLRVWRSQQTDAILHGMEASEEGHVTGPLWLTGRFDFVHGGKAGSDDPIAEIPPARGAMGAKAAWEKLGWANRFQVGTEVEMVAEKKRLEEDELATGSYTLVHGDAGIQKDAFGRGWDVTLRVRNAANKRYKDFLSRYKEFALNPGRDIALRLSTTF